MLCVQYEVILFTEYHTPLALHINILSYRLFTEKDTSHRSVASCGISGL